MASRAFDQKIEEYPMLESVTASKRKRIGRILAIRKASLQFDFIEKNQERLTSRMAGVGRNASGNRMEVDENDKHVGISGDKWFSILERERLEGSFEGIARAEKKTEVGQVFSRSYRLTLIE